MEPMVRRMSEKFMVYIYNGCVEKMEAICSDDTYNSLLTKYGNIIVVQAMKTSPLSMTPGLKARSILVKKVLSLGVDLTPAFQKLTGADVVDQAGKAKALPPDEMLKTILASHPKDVRLLISSYCLDEFLVMIPLKVIKKSRKCDEAIRRRFEISGETDLLAFASTNLKGQVLEESLGL